MGDEAGMSAEDQRSLKFARLVAQEVKKELKDEIDRILVKYDGLAAANEEMQLKVSALVSDQQNMAGKLNKSLDVSKPLILELSELRYDTQREKLFELQSNVMVFGPKKAKDGKESLNAKAVKKTVGQHLPLADGFNYLQFSDIVAGMVKIRVAHPDSQIARQIAARVLKLKEKFAETYDAFPKHDEPKALRLQRKKIRGMLRSVKEKLKDEKTRISIYKGLVYYGDYPLFPEYLWPDAEVVPVKIVSELAEKVKVLQTMKIKTDFSDEQINRGIHYEFALDLLASYKGLPQPIEEQFELIDHMEDVG